MLTGTSAQPELFDYGIHNESADLRAHVCVLARKVYVFPRRPVVQIMKRFELKSAGQRGVIGKTAEGRVVPVTTIPYLKQIPISEERLIGFTEDLSTSEKGERAVNLVSELLKAGRFPLWVEGDLVETVNMQIDGDDIHVSGRWRIQVKCDFCGGRGEHPRCTGNLFLQTAERNPLKRI